MKTNIATTKEQSDRLLACGVSADTADMARYEDDSVPMMPWDWTTGSYGGTFPAWSLSALLGLLPSSILSPLGNEYMLELSKLRMHDAWEVQWFSGRDRFRTYDKKNFHKLWDKSPIEACVKAIEWLSENGYKLNEQ